MADLKTKYKFIEMVSADEFNKKPMYEIKNIKRKDKLGVIFYYPPWKQYTFTQYNENILFSHDCLTDIADFIKQLNAELKS